jgi:hypothetical protein
MTRVDAAAAAWQLRRSEFVHDWLRNRFLQRLHALVALSRSDVHAPAETLDSFAAVVREWPERGRDALRLADDYGDFMSPGRAAREMALEPCVSRFVQCAASRAWTARHGVQRTLSGIRVTHRRASDCYARWEGFDGSAVEELTSLARECEQLARAFAQLPGRVVL